MRKVALIFALMPLMAFAETDAEIALNNALEVVRTNCSGVSARMENIKKMAGIGTAVNAIGTAAGAGGVAAGVVKYKTDVNMIHSMDDKLTIDEMISRIKALELSPANVEAAQQHIVLGPDFEKNLRELAAELEGANTIEAKNNVVANHSEEVQRLEQHSSDIQKQIDKDQKKSTTLGNVRTGLFATDTVTNVAGAIASSKTVADENFIEQIKKCTDSISLLRDARIRSRAEDGADANQRQMELSQKIVEKCGEYEYVNLTPLNNMAKGAMAVNSIGVVTGAAATITSALGNNKKISDFDLKSENVAKEVGKYEKMNVASNALGGATAVASLTGTILNASQIKTAKEILNIAAECEDVLTW